MAAAQSLTKCLDSSLRCCTRDLCIQRGGRTPWTGRCRLDGVVLPGQWGGSHGAEGEQATQPHDVYASLKCKSALSDSEPGWPASNQADRHTRTHVIEHSWLTAMLCLVVDPLLECCTGPNRWGRIAHAGGAHQTTLCSATGVRVRVYRQATIPSVRRRRA